MMQSRLTRILIIVSSLLVASTSLNFAEAREGYWQGDVSTDWNTAGNWFVVGAPASGFVPQSSGGFNVRAIIGTDNPNGAVNTTLGNSPVISAAVPTAKATIGGLYLGARERDFLLNPPPFVNEPAPAAGALVGKLTITGGALNNVTTTESALGADGRIVVGQDGRGFLTMTGGTLTGPQLVVGGENFTGDALGTSLVDLSGTALLAISNATPASGTVALDRRLRISGPSARLTTNGPVNFGTASEFTAVITSASNPAGPAMIQSGLGVKMGGALNVEFSGAGATGHALGNKWNLLTGTTGVTNTFTNLGVGNQITPSGLASPAPLGSAYFLRTVNGGNGKLVQLSYEGVLVLNVNRSTGELKITNPLGGNIAIDGYQVTSNRGSMVAGYAGLGSSTPGAGVWVKGTNSVNGLFEIKEPDMTPPIDTNDALNLTSVPSVSLGAGFSRTGVAANVSNFGNHGEDLVFSYTSPQGGIFRGQIVYDQGTRFENNLVLRVNPNTGVATLKNDSLETLVFDGFDIASTEAALNIAGFTPVSGGTGTWQTDAEGTTGLSQVNFAGARTLTPNQEVSIGDISTLVSPFTSDAAKNGLTMRFILAEGLESMPANGDYNNNGTVDAADYTTWRNNLGTSNTLPNDTTPGTVTQDDYNVWKTNFGLTGGSTPDAEFRTGTIVFDASLGAGGGGLSGLAVPEPGTGLLLFAGLGSLLFTRRRKQCNQELRVDDSEQPVLRTGQVGASTMSRRVVFLALVAIGIVTVGSTARQAAAVTGGLPIVNFDMELPGPLGSKVVAFDATGAPIPGVIPGWTFTGPGTTLWGDEEPGDSGTEGGGTPGNAMLLNTNDGKVYQTVPSHTIINPPANQQYRVSFDASRVFATFVEGSDANLADGFRLTSRLYYGAYPGTTLMSQQIFGGEDDYEFLIPHNSPLLTAGVLGQPLGIEFDNTSVEYSIAEDPLNTIRDIVESWAHIDDVVFEIVGLIPGDLNGDGLVNTADAANLVPNLQRYTPFESQGELTGDNVVNLNDFRALKNLIAAAAGSGGGSAGLAGGSVVPEPSSIVLLLAMLGMAAGALARGRRRGACSRLLMLAVIAVGSSCVLTAKSNAELLFYDPFLIGGSPAAGEYAADAPLVGQNPTLPNTGGYGTQPDLLSGPWTLQAAAHSTHVLSKSAPGLNYIGAPAEGGSIGTVADPVDFGIDNRIGRKFKPGSEWTDTTVGTYYIGWLQNFGTGDFMGFRSMEFWRDPNGEIGDSNLLGDLGYNAYFSPLGSIQTNGETARFAFQHQIIEGSPVFIEDGATHLFVMKFVLSDVAESDQILIYLDPVISTEPEVPSLAITGIDVQLGALGIGQFGGFGDIMNTIDELRIGTTYLDVIPELPLPGDTDGDRDVDLDDYNNIISNLGLAVSTALQGDVAKADGSQGSDGRVTIADYRIWKDHYPTLPPAAGGGALAGTVPEPSSCLLIVLGMALAAVSENRAKGRI